MNSTLHQNRAPAETDRDIIELKAKLEQSNLFFASMLSQERASARHAVIFLGLISLIFTGFQVYNSVQAQSFMDNTQQRYDAKLLESEQKLKGALDDTEKRVERALNDTEPTRAFVMGTLSNEPNKVFFSATIQSPIEGGQQLTKVYLSSRFKVGVEGSLGRVIGINTRYVGPVLDYVARNVDGSENLLVREIQTDGVYFAQDNDGTLVSESAPLSGAGVGVGVYVKDCQTAEKLIDDITAAKALGKVYITPVFQRIKNPAKEYEFDIEVRRGDVSFCNEIRWK